MVPMFQANKSSANHAGHKGVIMDTKVKIYFVLMIMAIIASTTTFSVFGLIAEYNFTFGTTKIVLISCCLFFLMLSIVLLLLYKRAKEKAYQMARDKELFSYMKMLENKYSVNFKHCMYCNHEIVEGQEACIGCGKK